MEKKFNPFNPLKKSFLISLAFDNELSVFAYSLPALIFGVKKTIEAIHLIDRFTKWQPIADYIKNDDGGDDDDNDVFIRHE